jgi:hypothetical protein
MTIDQFIKDNNLPKNEKSWKTKWMDILYRCHASQRRGSRRTNDAKRKRTYYTGM